MKVALLFRLIFTSTVCLRLKGQFTAKSKVHIFLKHLRERDFCFFSNTMGVNGALNVVPKNAFEKLGQSQVYTELNEKKQNGNLSHKSWCCINKDNRPIKHPSHSHQPILAPNLLACVFFSFQRVSLCRVM